MQSLTDVQPLRFVQPCNWWGAWACSGTALVRTDVTLHCPIFPKRAVTNRVSVHTTPPTVLEDFDFVFAENGLVAYEAGKLLAVQSIAKHLGEESLQRLLNFMLQYLSGGGMDDQ